MPSDDDLLRRYVFHEDHEAFSELVGRRLGLVYSAALRRVGGQRSMAEDVTQKVFSDLARKAPNLIGHPSLLGWLHLGTRYAAIDALREAQRRRQLNQLLSDEPTNHGFIQEEPDWASLRPAIDEALDHLKVADREVVLLRHVSGLSFASVGARVGLSENAARMRANRALNKLRRFLERRGVTSSTAALAIALEQPGFAAVPSALAPSVAAAALAAAATEASVSAFTLRLLAMKKSLLLTAVLALSGLGSAWFLINRFGVEEHLSVPPLPADTDSRTTSASVVTRESAGSAGWPAGLRAASSRIESWQPAVTTSEPGSSTLTKNRGQSTAADAAETMAWATYHADVEVISKLIMFDERAREPANELWDSLPESARKSWPTALHLYALFAAADSIDHPPPTDPAVFREAVVEQVASDRAIFRWPGGNFSQEYRWTPEGWKLLLGRGAVTGLARQLQGSQPPKP